MLECQALSYASQAKNVLYLTIKTKKLSSRGRDTMTSSMTTHQMPQFHHPKVISAVCSESCL